MITPHPICLSMEHFNIYEVGFTFEVFPCMRRESWVGVTEVPWVFSKVREVTIKHWQTCQHDAQWSPRSPNKRRISMKIGWREGRDDCIGLKVGGIVGSPLCSFNFPWPRVKPSLQRLISIHTTASHGLDCSLALQVPAVFIHELHFCLRPMTKDQRVTWVVVSVVLAVVLLLFLL